MAAPLNPMPPPRCGPAGWSYPDWCQTVYPRPKPHGFHPLEYLSQHFDAVEVDSSFYQDPRPEIVKVWLRRVSDNPEFRFTVKLNRRFTHDRRLDPAGIRAFRTGLEPIKEAGRLGCLLMQFPWSFRFTEENREFLIRLRREFGHYPLVAEMRHSSWMCDEGLGLLIDYHVGFCNLDQPQRAGAMPPTAFLTSAVGYVRLHGRSYGSWFEEFEEPPRVVARRDYLYSPAELAEWKARIDRVRRFADAFYVITTNDAGGRSVLNALQLQAMFGVVRRAPATLAKTYRRQLEGFRPDAPVQRALFPPPEAALKEPPRQVA